VQRTLDWIRNAQEFHELVNNYIGGFVLHPVANIVEFEPAHHARETTTHLVYGQRIEFFQPVHPSPNEKGRLSDLRALECGRQIEIRFSGAVIVERTVRSAPFESR
jgi:hypothetical protein